MGDPWNITKDSAPSWDKLENNTFVTAGDIDASPTKAWLIAHRNDPKWKRHYEIAFGKRPREELYVIADDPDQMNNVANDPNYTAVRQEMEARLLAELNRAGDPRVTETPCPFDAPPFVGKTSK